MTTEPTSSVLACDMSAMTPAQRQRHSQITAQLRQAVQQMKELPDGYAFCYPSDPKLFLEAAEFITLESRCCPFFHFRLEQEPNQGPMCLFVTGPKGAKSFIKSFLGSS